MRRTLRVTIPGEHSDEFGQRDNGKTFVITEMAADTAERWAIRALLAMETAGVEIPDGAAEAGIAALAEVGLKAILSMDWKDADPLLTEMMTCVQYEHKEGQPLQGIMEGAGSQIEEVKTRLLLRAKVFELHTGFSVPVVPRTSG